MQESKHINHMQKHEKQIISTCMSDLCDFISLSSVGHQ
jgi:hypothetical protein